MKYLIMTIFLINTAFAQNAVKLNKGDITPFKGVLVTEDKLIELDKAQRSNLVLSDLRITQDELIEYHKDSARSYRKQLAEAQFSSFWTNSGYFLLGVVLTGFTFKISQKIGDI